MWGVQLHVYCSHISCPICTCDQQNPDVLTRKKYSLTNYSHFIKQLNRIGKKNYFLLKNQKMLIQILICMKLKELIT